MMHDACVHIKLYHVSIQILKFLILIYKKFWKFLIVIQLSKKNYNSTAD